MIIDDASYLEHFGVKGMRWGVRKQHETSAERSPPKVKKKLTPEQRARRIQIGLAVLSGTLAVGSILLDAHSSNKRASAGVKALKADNARSKVISDAISSVGKTKVSDIRPPAAAKKAMGHVSPETKKFLADFDAKQKLLNAAANADLKAGYERNQVPIHLREYLSAWDDL